VAASRDSRWYRETFGAPFYGLHRVALQRLLAGAFGPEHLHLGGRVEELEETRAGLRVRCVSGAAFDAAVVVGQPDDRGRRRAGRRTRRRHWHSR
jgi:hypothetical protein